MVTTAGPPPKRACNEILEKHALVSPEAHLCQKRTNRSLSAALQVSLLPELLSSRVYSLVPAGSHHLETQEKQNKIL